MMEPATFDVILGDIAAGEATHRALTEHGVRRKAFYALLATDAEAGNRYARAKQAGLEVMADEIVEISDEGRHDEYIDDSGAMVTNQDVIARARLRVDSRKWLLSKLAPKKYGDKVTNEHTGADGGPVVVRLDSADGRL